MNSSRLTIFFLFLCLLSSPGCQLGRGTKAAPVGRIPIQVTTNLTGFEDSEREAIKTLIDGSLALPQTPEPAGSPGLKGYSDAVQKAAALLAPTHRSTADYLNKAATILAGSDERIEDLDRLVADASKERLLILFGPGRRAENSNNSLLSHIEISRRSEVDEPWLSAYHSRLSEFEHWLPIPKGHHSLEGSPRDSLVIANIIFKGGTLAQNGSMSTRRPHTKALVDELGTTYFFYKNLLEKEWYENEVKSTSNLVLVERHRHLASPRAHLNFFATRFSSYQLGPQTVSTDESETPIPLRKHFGASWAPLIIAKADLTGILAHEWLIREELEAAELSDQNLAMLVTMSFRSLYDAGSGVAPPAHAHASLIILNWLTEKNAIGFDQEEGGWDLNLDTIRTEVRNLLSVIFQIHATGDIEKADELVKAYAVMTQNVVRTLDTMNAIGGKLFLPTWVVNEEEG